MEGRKEGRRERRTQLRGKWRKKGRGKGGRNVERKEGRVKWSVKRKSSLALESISIVIVSNFLRHFALDFS